MKKQRRKEVIQIKFSADEIDAINEWRFKHRLPTFAAAVRELVCRGIESEEMDDPPANQPTETYGVIDCN